MRAMASIHGESLLKTGSSVVKTSFMCLTVCTARDLALPRDYIHRLTIFNRVCRYNYINYVRITLYQNQKFGLTVANVIN